jgi:antitoxin MazE
MKGSVTRIGNSRGLRIPKPLLEQCGLEDQVELEVRNGELIVRPARRPREGWDEAFHAMAERGDDALLDQGAQSRTEWDREEWQWK